MNSQIFNKLKYYIKQYFINNIFNTTNGRRNEYTENIIKDKSIPVEGKDADSQAKSYYINVAKLFLKSFPLDIFNKTINDYYDEYMGKFHPYFILQMTDAYTCLKNNEDTEIILKCNSNSTEVIPLPSSVSVFYGESIRLTILYSDTYEYTWYNNGDKIHTGFMLILNNVTESNRYLVQYTHQNVNAGTFSCYVRIIYPAVISNLRSYVTDTSVKVICTASSSVNMDNQWYVDGTPTSKEDNLVINRKEHDFNVSVKCKYYNSKSEISKCIGVFVPKLIPPVTIPTLNHEVLHIYYGYQITVRVIINLIIFPILSILLLLLIISFIAACRRRQFKMKNNII